MASDILDTANTKFDAAIEHLQSELVTMRTGRATTSLVENVQVSVYEQAQPLRALANISTPDAKSITISPWDPTTIAPIEKAIREDESLDLNPQNDGKNIHINIPPMTAERREQFTKTLGERAEETKISLRNSRHEAIDAAKKQQKDGDISEDEYHRIEKELNTRIDELQSQIDETVENKKQELMEV